MEMNPEIWAAKVGVLAGWHGHLERDYKGQACLHKWQRGTSVSTMGQLITKGEDKLGPSGDKPEETLYFNIYHIVSCISIVIIDGSLI